MQSIFLMTMTVALHAFFSQVVVVVVRRTTVAVVGFTENKPFHNNAITVVSTIVDPPQIKIGR